jgi:mannitol/fructose-specific phosphotransferase system IIA component (Ntr-type)/predicted DNA-binding transcriptional regulator AlpA
MKKVNEKKDFLNLRETSDLLSVSIPTLNRWVRQGTIISHRSEKEIKFSSREIQEWVRATGFRVPDNTVKIDHITDLKISPEGQFIRALHNGFLMQYSQPIKRDQLYLNMIEIYSSSTNSSFNKQNLFKRMTEREESLPTTITPDIAIPHARRNSDFTFSPSAICTAVLSQPISINSISLPKTRIFFFLFSENPEQHLNLLSSIARAVSSMDKLTEKVYHVSSLQELISLFKGK